MAHSGTIIDCSGTAKPLQNVTFKRSVTKRLALNLTHGRRVTHPIWYPALTPHQFTGLVSLCIYCGDAVGDNTKEKGNGTHPRAP